MKYSNIKLSEFIIEHNEIIQPERIKTVTDIYNFKHIRWAPYVCCPGNPNIHFNYKRIYFFERVKSRTIITYGDCFDDSSFIKDNIK